MPLIPADPSSLTADWFSEVLDADVRECKIEQIGVGVGLLGRLFRVHLAGGPDMPATVVVKLPTTDLTARTAICELGDFYLREIRFYQEVSAANPLPAARPYYAAFDEPTHDFVLVLEDLGRLRNADQTIGCSVADAETLIDTLARHQAYWWDNDRLASLTWLTRSNVGPIAEVARANYQRAWPVFLERLGCEIPWAVRDFGERLPTIMPWMLNQLARPPLTFVHGDLRLDQLFFAVEPDDPPVTALDWQITSKSRGAYDVGYFLSQSLDADTRRSTERQLLDRYAERLAEHGIVYPRDQLLLDYRLTVAWCFTYPVIGAGRIEAANDRQLELLRTMARGAAEAIEDHGCLTLGPD